MWICTKDHSFKRDGGTSRVNVTSSDYDKEIFDEYKKLKEVKRWLTKDDDGNKIHEGLFAYHGDTPESEFDPLDDLSQPDCGATDIYHWSEFDENWEAI